MARHALAFAFNRQNRHTVSVLIGALEADGRFDDLAIHLLDPRADLGEQIETLAADHQVVVVGFSFTTFTVLEVYEAVRNIRRLLLARDIENVTLVAGGPHASGDYRQTLDMGFDVVVVGEGERSFPELLACLNDGKSIGHIKGVATCGPGGVSFTGRSPRVENLDEVPPFAEKFGLFSMIEITRGCPWACRFCQATFLFGARMRHRSVENIVLWAEKSRRFDEQWDIRLLTPDALAYGSDGRTQRLDLLAEMLQAVNSVVGKERTYLGSFPSEVRPESVTRDGIELLRDHVANDNIIIGAQSGSPRMLRLSHRGHTVEDIRRAVEITLSAGLVANVDFIFGMPGEQESDSYLTRRLIRELAAMGARIHSHAFMPLTGTPWAGEKPGRVDEQTLSLLQSLAGSHQQYGQWRRQQEVAQAVAEFRDSTMIGPCETTVAQAG
jgi:B12-binding domain/radical SAM domain protein